MDNFNNLQGFIRQSVSELVSSERSQVEQPEIRDRPGRPPNNPDIFSLTSSYKYAAEHENDNVAPQDKREGGEEAGRGAARRAVSNRTLQLLFVHLGKM